MVLWGAVCGGLFGLIAGRWDGSGLIIGAILGAFAGRYLQRSIDARVAALLKQHEVAQRIAVRATVAEALRSASVEAATEPDAGSSASSAAAPATAPATASAPATAQAPARAPAPSAAAAPAAEDPAFPAAAGAAPAVAHTALPVDAAEAATSAPPPPAAPSPIEVALQRAKAWLLGGNTVARLGAVVLFIGLAFLARFAAERGLVPVQLRLAGIAIVGIVLLAVGFRMRNARAGYALTLQGAGVAVLYLTIFTAMRLYAFVPPLPAFALMVALCALSGLLAVLQDSRALAIIGTAGGFVTPILVSTGEGNHVALFSYYAVLNAGILGIAWKKDWRLLNLVGFAFTFGIATLWGVLRFTPHHYASTQPFLAGYVVLYVAVSALFALRRAPKLSDYVDATLVFGVPLVGFGLQAGLVRHFEYGLAWSAVALAAFYLALAAALMRTRLAQLRLLIECFVALGVVFASLAIPFALDARWTAAAWALEGAGAVWVGARQERRLARAFGVLLQGGGALAFALHLEHRLPQPWPLLNADFIGATLIAVAAIFTAKLLWQRRAAGDSGSESPASRPASVRIDYSAFERALASPLFLYGFAWWIAALILELSRHHIGAAGTLVDAIAPQSRLYPLMAGYVLSAAVACRAGLRSGWRAATWPAHASLPVMLATAGFGSLIHRHVFEHYGFVCWPIAIAAHLVALRALGSDAAGHRGFALIHAGGVWLLALLAGSLGAYLIDRAELWRTAWGPAATLVAVALVVYAIGRLAISPTARQRWPMQHFARAYGWLGLGPITGLGSAAAMLITVTDSANATPLSHLPLLNPIDLAVLLALAAIWWWREQASATDWPLPAIVRDRRVWLAAFGLALFVWVNTVWLRIVHHFFGVRWDGEALFRSFVVQTGYALLWSATAMALMVLASRRRLRMPWLVGTGLLGLTVLKLFVVDLSNAGGTERIIAFIGVGVLMLLIGYVAPIPPQAKPATSVEAS